MKASAQDLEARYISALKDYLASQGEPALQQAYELGREVLDQGSGVLEMATLHHKALAGLLAATPTPEEAARIVMTAGGFFIESLGPFEMTHRGFREASTTLLRLNERLEEEAKRIAHALHDEAGQMLAWAYIALAEVARDLPVPFQGGLQQVKAALEKIEEQLRRMSHELRPTILDDLGLLPALEFLADGISKRANLPITVSGPKNGRLPFSIETALYRIVQEALTNVARHARATHVNVQLVRGSQMISCSITDDGIGFDVATVMSMKGREGLGLVGIRDRLGVLKGALQVNSEPGTGTELLIRIPLED